MKTPSPAPRLFVPLVLTLTAGLISIASIAGSLAAAPPNILLIVSEDNGPELGCYGNPDVTTPNLDRLSTEGIRFDRAFVPQAGCSQSRASFLTGLYPHQHGQIGLATWGFRMYRETTPNLPKGLREVGYRTGIIGKLHVNPESAFPFDFEAIPRANFDRKNLRDYAANAAKFIGQDDRPFFLSVNYPDAHDPWIRQVDGLPANPLTGKDVTPMPYFGVDAPELRELVADYYNCINRLDTLVGDLLDVLHQSGKADNTIVIYLGDHGADMLRAKRTCYEGGVRIPLIVRWPARIRPQVRDEMVMTIDLMPTLLQLAGGKAVEGLPGISLVPIFDGQQPTWRTHLFTEFHTHAAAINFYPQRAVRDGRYKLIENLLPGEPNPGYRATFTKDLAKVEYAVELAPPEVQQAYARMRVGPKYELYDLENDPYEFRTLVDSPAHAEIFADLKGRLAKWRAETSDPLLSEQNLRRLQAEVKGLKKAQAKDFDWQYPNYFFAK